MTPLLNELLLLTRPYLLPVSGVGTVLGLGMGALIVAHVTDSLRGAFHQTALACLQIGGHSSQSCQLSS